MAAVFYLGAGWRQWKRLGIPGSHLHLSEAVGLSLSLSLFAYEKYKARLGNTVKAVYWRIRINDMTIFHRVPQRNYMESRSQAPVQYFLHLPTFV